MTADDGASREAPYENPIVTVDVVLLTLRAERLQVALSERDKPPHEWEWTLPGGWVHANADEDALAAAERILNMKAGVESPYLEQLQTFAGRHRDPRGWSVSIAYYALVSEESLKGAPKGTQIKWRAVDEIRSLPFDHLDILNTAVARLRSKTRYSSLPVHLMPAAFTLSELQRVYETVLGSSLDKRGFRRRIEELDVVEPVPGKSASGQAAHRPAQRYRVKRSLNRRVATAERVFGLKGD